MDRGIDGRTTPQELTEHVELAGGTALGRDAEERHSTAMAAVGDATGSAGDACDVAAEDQCCYACCEGAACDGDCGGCDGGGCEIM